MNTLYQHKNEIAQLCIEHDVKSLFAFGSVLTDGFNAQSDIDLIVDMESDNPLVYTDNYFALKDQLEQLFKRKVDLLEERAIKNPFLKKRIDHTKVLVYGR